ncbi:phage tail protein [Stutzerimonas stutzeri]|uniref:phage tail protein n=1 Tax=Stutzerimonas stutzeri TaxID=316 RepID=UPI000F7A4C03|nr:phage tail protein [Stutzerimonas stutzeri]RRV38613.1 phage tail protein [Stutzerimonas stutzeri]RRV38676.1 phage tail protein [Stutzerimonas stutzeri]
MAEVRPIKLLDVGSGAGQLKEFEDGDAVPDSSRLGGQLPSHYATQSDLAGVTPGPEFYKRSNILGTVSQSGGVPTGAIIERGSNANGEYVRFADGTQICWLVVEETLAVTAAYGASKYGSRGWVFPAGFSAQPAIAASARTTANLLTATPLDLPGSWSNTSCNWAFVDVAGTSYTGTARMTFSANGRWY